MGYSTKEGTEELEDERRRHLLKECIMQLLGLKTMHVKWALSLLQIVQDVKIVSSEVEIRIPAYFAGALIFMRFQSLSSSTKLTQIKIQ